MFLTRSLVHPHIYSLIYIAIATAIVKTTTVKIIVGNAAENKTEITVIASLQLL